jgi:hypothetical protein
MHLNLVEGLYKMSSLFLNGVSDDLATSINIGQPKVNASGGKNIPIFNRVARSGLKVSTPMMLTWGVNENDFDGTGKKTYDMSLQFPSAEYASADTSAFLDNLKRLETMVKEQACANSKAWFGKVQSAEVVEAFWTPMLRYPKDKATGEPDYTKSPTFRVKLPFWDGKFKFEIFNVKGELVFPKDDINIMDVVPKGSEAKIILQCGGIWFAGGKFGITWKPFQMIVKPKLQLTQGVCHIMTEDIKDAPKEELKESTEQSTLVESDDEDPDREYATPAAEPTEPTGSAEPEVPVKGKRKVVKKP